MIESPLADCVPLWRTLREDGVTAIVTPSLDYIGALELGGVDIRFVTDDVLAGVGESLRGFVGGLDDSINLLFAYRVHDRNEEDIRSYSDAVALAETRNPALAAYAQARADWLREQKTRRARLFVFFSRVAASKSALERGHLGMRLMFKSAAKITTETHRGQLKTLASLRDRIATRLRQIGVESRELSVSEVVGSSRVDLQACKLEYSIVSPK